MSVAFNDKAAVPHREPLICGLLRLTWVFHVCLPLSNMCYDFISTPPTRQKIFNAYDRFWQQTKAQRFLLVCTSFDLVWYNCWIDLFILGPWVYLLRSLHGTLWSYNCSNYTIVAVSVITPDEPPALMHSVWTFSREKSELKCSFNWHIYTFIQSDS